MAGQIGHFKFPEPGSATGAQPGPVVPDFGTQPPRIGPAATSIAPATDSFWRRLSAGAFGALVSTVGVLLLLILSFAPYYSDNQQPQSVKDACSSLTGTDYRTCVHETLGDQRGTVAIDWNAWGSWFSWPAVLLFLLVAIVVGFKAAFSKSDKVALAKRARLALYVADALFLFSLFHIPHDNAGRSWGLWLSLVCVIAINIGILLATTEVGEWIAEHWPRRGAPAAPSAGHP